jgi:hypothetical protein
MAVEHLTDLETRVLGVLEQRSGLDVEQIASAGRLQADAAIQALQGLSSRRLIIAETGKFGPTYQLNRTHIQQLIAA